MRVQRLLFDAEVMRLMSMTIFAKPLGLVTQILLASYFGAGIRLDAYVFTLFLVEFFDGAVGNVYNAVVIPLTIKFKARFDSIQVLKLQNAIYLLFLGPALIYMSILLLRSELVISILGPKMPSETRVYIVKMLKMMAVPGIILLMVTMLKATLNLNKRFRMPAAMPVFKGVIVLVNLVLLQKHIGIWALPVGFAIANISQFIVLGIYGLVKRCTGLVRPSVPSGLLSKLWALSWMVLVAQTFLRVNQFIDKMFASGLEPGSISSISYSMTIVNFGLQLFLFSLIPVMFTNMSEYFAKGDMSGGNDYIQTNLNRLSRIVVPVSLALCLTSDEIVRVLFQRGAFDASDTNRTAGALAMYLLGLPAVIINSLVARIFFSLQKVRDRMWLAAQYLLTNALGNFLLVKSLKVMGLAISSSVAINIHLVLSLVILHNYRTGLNVPGFLTVIGRAYVQAGITYLVYRFSGFGGMLDGWDIGVTVPGAILVAAVRFFFIMAVYIISLLIWRWVSARSR